MNLLIIYTFILLLFSFGSQATDQKSFEFIWFDGKTQKKTYLINNVIMEFKNHSRYQTFISNSKLIFEKNGIKIFKVNDSEFKKNILTQKVNTKVNISPVFTDNPGSPWSRSLPGGIIVAFDKKLSEIEIKILANQNGLNLEKKLPLLGASFWSVSTPAGFSSLNTALKAKNIEGVLWASPNWLENVQNH